MTPTPGRQPRKAGFVRASSPECASQSAALGVIENGAFELKGERASSAPLIRGFSLDCCLAAGYQTVIPSEARNQLLEKGHEASLALGTTGL
jgi:hypothetical protein